MANGILLQHTCSSHALQSTFTQDHLRNTPQNPHPTQSEPSGEGPAELHCLCPILVSQHRRLPAGDRRSEAGFLTAPALCPPLLHLVSGHPPGLRWREQPGQPLPASEGSQAENGRLPWLTNFHQRSSTFS